MLEKRIIPSIYVAEGQNHMGDTSLVHDYTKAFGLALQFEADGAGEIIVMDITTQTERRRGLPKFLKELTSTLKIPLVFGGGVHTVDDVKEFLKAGATRIYVNSAAVRNPELIYRSTKECGKDSILVAIDARLTFGSWKVYLNGGKARTEMDLLNWVKMVEVRGAGEILISLASKNDNSIQGAIDILNQITQTTHLSVLGAIGAQTKEEFKELFESTSITGVVSSSYFIKEPHAYKELQQYFKNEQNA
jgi:cyclase